MTAESNKLHDEAPFSSAFSLRSVDDGHRGERGGGGNGPSGMAERESQDKDKSGTRGGTREREMDRRGGETEIEERERGRERERERLCDKVDGSIYLRREAWRGQETGGGGGSFAGTK